jgi:hypothetical protein
MLYISKRILKLLARKKIMRSDNNEISLGCKNFWKLRTLLLHKGGCIEHVNLLSKRNDFLLRLEIFPGTCTIQNMGGRTSAH